MRRLGGRKASAGGFHQLVHDADRHPVHSTILDQLSFRRSTCLFEHKQRQLPRWKLPFSFSLMNEPLGRSLFDPSRAHSY